MSINKSQQFIYFQNKARHYDNLRKIKPAIKTRYGNKFTTLSPESPRMSYLQQYEIQKQNQGLINRITDILHSEKPMVMQNGYTRYNNQIYPKSHLEIETKKSLQNIDQENYMLATKMIYMKPAIGTVHDWGLHFKKIKEMKKNISKFDDSRTSRGQIEVYSSTSKFMPQHYRSFLNKSLHAKRSDSIARSKNEFDPEQMPINMTLKIEKLFQLPKLQRMRGSLTTITDFGKKIQ